MIPRLLDLRLPERIHGHGTLETERGSVPVARFSVTHHKHDPASPWEAEIFVAAEERDNLEQLIRWSRRPPSLRGITDSGYAIVVPELWWNQLSAGVLHGQPDEIQLAHGPATGVVRQSLRAELSPTDLAVPEIGFLMATYAGEITRKDGLSTPNHPLRWSSPLGDGTLVTHFRYEQVPVGRVKGTLQIPLSFIHIPDIVSHQVSREPVGLARTFIADLDPVLRLLSFLSRRHVDWRSVEMMSELGRPGSRNEFRTDLVMNGRMVPEEHRPEGTLINPHRSGPDALDSMIGALLSSPYRGPLSSAMLYVVVAHQTRFVEPVLVSAITALETVVNGVTAADGADRILDPGTFSDLSQALTATIGRFSANQSNLTDTQRDVLRRLRIGDLNRLPIVPRAVSLVGRYSLEWRDLWPPGIDLGKGLRAVFRRRARFLHAGTLGSLARAHDDARRALAITERLIYAILGGQAKWQDVSVYSPYYYLSQVQMEPEEEDFE